MRLMTTVNCPGMTLADIGGLDPPCEHTEGGKILKADLFINRLGRVGSLITNPHAAPHPEVHRPFVGRVPSLRARLEPREPEVRLARLAWAERLCVQVGPVAVGSHLEAGVLFDRGGGCVDSLSVVATIPKISSGIPNPWM